MCPPINGVRFIGVYLVLFILTVWSTYRCNDKYQARLRMITIVLYVQFRCSRTRLTQYPQFRYSLRTLYQPRALPVACSCVANTFRPIFALDDPNNLHWRVRFPISILPFIPLIEFANRSISTTLSVSLRHFLLQLFAHDSLPPGTRF